jgi:DNA repair protein RecO (recombination protein O)
MIFNERAIVLSKRTGYGEDVYVCLIGERSGVFWAVAKRARKSKKRFLNILEPPTLISAYIRKTKFSETLILEKAELEDIFYNIKTSFEKLLCGWFGIELVMALSFSSECFHNLFEFINDISSSETKTDILIEKTLNFSLNIIIKEGFSSESEIKKQNWNNSQKEKIEWISKKIEEIYGKKLKFVDILEKLYSEKIYDINSF